MKNIIGYIYDKASDMAKSKMCAYTQSNHVLPHWKFLLWCCANFPCINLPEQETDDLYSNRTPSTLFHIYHIIEYCTAHGIIPLKDNKICRKCRQESSTDKSTKMYIRKDLLMM